MLSQIDIADVHVSELFHVIVYKYLSVNKKYYIDTCIY